MYVQQQQQPQQVYVQQEPQQAVSYQPFDYRKFLDFSFFANTAAAFGGAPSGYVQQQPQQQTLTIQKQILVPAASQTVIEPQQQIVQQQVVPNTGAFIQKSYIASPLIVSKHWRRHHHPKRIYVEKIIV